MQSTRLFTLLVLVALPLVFESSLERSVWPALLALGVGVLLAVPVHAFAMPRFRRSALAAAVFGMPLSFFGAISSPLGVTGSPLQSLWFSPGLGLVVALLFDELGRVEQPAED